MKPTVGQYEKIKTTSRGLKIYILIAKAISYGRTRALDSIKYIVIHHTGNSGDSAWGNAHYFSPKGGNKRNAGAHFFVDKEGIVFKSIPMGRTAYAVGGLFTRANGAGKYYQKCTNSNSVSIELCSYTRGYPTKAQVQAVKLLIEYIQETCPNALTIIRHWDVNGKSCPAPMVGKSNDKWKKLLKAIKG